MKLPTNTRKFFGRIRNRICRIFGRKIDDTLSKVQENIKPSIENHRRLPLELECEIFKCLPLPIQRKFISGMGKGIYEIFGRKLLTKTKRLCNPKANKWNGNAFNGLQPLYHEYKWKNIYTEKGFSVSIEHCIRNENNRLPRTILYYYEVTHKTSKYWPHFFVGLSGAPVPYDSFIGKTENSYALLNGARYCLLANEEHHFECPPNVEEKIKLEWNGPGDVIGCGLLLNPANELAIFFTYNGILLGKQIPINNPGCCLFPTVSIYNVSLVANFGDDPAKPFKFDIRNCPGLV